MASMKTLFQVFKLGRLHFVAAGLLLFMAGALLAVLSGAPLSISRLAFGYLVFMPAHLSTNYSNDYHDVEADQHGSTALFTGGSGVLVQHPELRPFTRWLALGLIALSLSLGVVFMLAYSYPVWFLGYVLLGNLMGWFYAAPPLRLAYRGLGEYATALTLGVLVPGMGYLVVAGRFDPVLFVLCIPFTLFGFAFIYNVQIPDQEADRLGQKWTFVARRGRQAGFVLAGVALTLASGYFFLRGALWGMSYPVSLVLMGVFSLFPLSVGMMGLVRRPAERIGATRLVNALLTMLILFFVLTDSYFVYLLRR